MPELKKNSHSKRAVSLISARAGDMIEVVAYLARNQGKLCRTALIGEEMGVDRKTLDESLRYLVRAGIVESSRGKYGGYRLRVKPESLTLYDIVEITDSATGCSMSRVAFGRWRYAKEGIRTALQIVTIADII